MVTWEALDALSHAFELSGIGPSTSVVALVADDGELTSLVRAALARSRAEAIEVRPVRSGPDGLAHLTHGNLLRDLLADVDVVVDALPGNGLGDVDDDLVTTARVLRLADAAAQAHLRPPHANMAGRVEALVDHVTAGAELRLSDDHGTDLVMQLDGAMIAADRGRASADDRTATYPAGWVRVTPAGLRVSGDVVLMPGDANLSRGSHISSPIRLTVRNDMITTIDGDSADADVVRALFEHLDDPDAYGIASISLGLNPGAPLSGAPFEAALTDPTLARLTAGVVCLSFGDNLHADRPSAGTITLALSRRTLEVDGIALTAHGDLLGALAPDVYELPG